MRIWEMFPEVAKRIQCAHKDADLTGHHDFTHAKRVGEVARKIALKEWGNKRLSHLAGIAGLCHNADHIRRVSLNLGRKDVPEGEVRELVSSWVRDVLKDGFELSVLVHAVLKHSNKNLPTDSRVLIALMDADRVVNMDVDLLIRSGQLYHDIPAVDYERWLDDPEATFREPRSCLRDIIHTFDWVDEDGTVSIRTALGREMAQRRAGVLIAFFAELHEQLNEEGIVVPAVPVSR